MSNGVTHGNTLGAYILQATLTPVAVSANTTAEQSFTVPGVKPGDYVDVCCPGNTAGVQAINKRISAVDTLAITFGNFTAGSLTPLAGNHIIQVCRPEGQVPKSGIGG